MDCQRKKHLLRSELSHIPFLRMEISQEQDAIVERKILRHAEHLRRGELYKQRQGELQQITQAKLERIANMDMALMNEEVTLAPHQRYGLGACAWNALCE